jgi:DtxR family Mn-dependent transcriptional regulator
MSEEQAEKISQLLGNPRYDPHGDPIPSPDGQLPPKRGIPMKQLDDLSVAEIVHIEDEPKEIYADILNRGLHPGMQIQRTGESGGNILVRAEGREIVLPSVLVENISVRKKPVKTLVEGAHDSLDLLAMGATAEVVGISKACRGQQRRRLMDLGVIPGTVVTPEMESMGHDPRAYRIRGALIALRRDQAQHIFIRKLKEVA